MHAVENQLSPHFCAKLCKSWEGVNDGDLLDIVLPVFSLRPKYGAAVLRAMGASFDVAVRTFYGAMEQPRLTWHLRPDLDLIQEAPIDEFGELDSSPQNLRIGLSDLSL